MGAAGKPTEQVRKVEQGRGKMGREPVLPSRPPVAHTKLDPQMSQQWRELMSILYAHLKKLLLTASPLSQHSNRAGNVCAPREWELMLYVTALSFPQLF